MSVDSFEWCGRMWVCLMIGSMGLWACGGDDGVVAPKAYRIVAEAGFDETFSMLSEVRLAFHADDPLGYIGDLLITDEGLVLADQVQSNIKVFSRSGILEKTLGRPGDGPGELRGPTVLAEHPGGGFVVADSRARAKVYLPGTSALEPFGQLPTTRMVGLEWVGSGSVFLVSGLYDDGENRFGAVLWSADGGSETPFHSLPRHFDEMYRGNFLQVRAVPMGDRYASLDHAGNRLRLTEPTDSKTSEWLVTTAGYAPPNWPSGQLEDRSALTDWARTQWWGSALIPVGRRLVIGFVRGSYSRSSRREYSYAVANPASRTQVVVKEHSNLRFMAVRGDTLFAIRIGDEYGEEVWVSSHLLADGH